MNIHHRKSDECFIFIISLGLHRLMEREGVDSAFLTRREMENVLQKLGLCPWLVSVWCL